MIVAIDEGTTGVRAVAVDDRGRLVDSAYSEFRQIYPKPGWVEHDPEEIWRVTLDVLQAVAKDATAIGITNQRETTLIWDRKSGKPVYNAIVWQCRRTAADCDRLRARGLEKTIRRKTGLVIDAYFSATKLRWILRHVRPTGDLCFGTIDSWLLWNLTGGKVHATDPTNASRTMLYDITRRRWDDDLLKLFKVPRAMLPRCAARPRRSGPRRSSAARSPSTASPATSRRRSTARAASRRTRSRTPTAPAAS